VRVPRRRNIDGRVVRPCAPTDRHSHNRIMRCNSSHLARPLYAMVVLIYHTATVTCSPSSSRPPILLAQTVQQDFWQAYQWSIITALVLLAIESLLIVGLLRERRRKKSLTRSPAQTALIKSEEFNRRIVESSSDCVKVLDLDGNIIYMSEQGQKLLEVTRIDALLGTSWINLWKGEDRQNARAAVESAKNGASGSFRGVGKTLKGKPKWWHTVISPMYGTNGNVERLLAVSRDMTEHELSLRAIEQSEKDRRLSEREFSTLVENSPDVICRLDRDLRYIYVSPALETLTGVPSATFLGKTSGETTVPDFGFEAVCRAAIESKKLAQQSFSCNERYYSTRAIPELSLDGSVESVMTITEDVTDRIRSEQELVQLTVRLFDIQDQERRRIARELHDGTAQNLFAISMNLQKMSQLDDSSNHEFAQLVAECESLGEQSLKEIRTLSYLLHPPLLDQTGLVSALQWYVEGFTKRSGIFVDVFAEPIGRLPSDTELALFRVVQEALANVHRHSTSETASIRLEHRNGEVVLQIKDRGKGLAIDDHSADTNGGVSLGVGIPGMKQRLRQLGGSLDISSDHTGTTVSAVVPIEKGVDHGTNTFS
jgi:PAS domain S-box-containing protein